MIPPDPKRQPPTFVKGREALYERKPREAVLEWFLEAGRGLFLEFGVYTQLRRGPWVQFDERIPLERYRELGSTFDPGGFDAARLADLALECGLGYVGLTARHADGFCLFRTIETEFNTLETSGRDLVGELADACRTRGLGLVLSYSYAADWRHPHFFPPEASRSDWTRSRPPYDAPDPHYQFEKDEDFLHYVRYAHNQLQEIVYRYRQLAGIRLEPLAGYRARTDLFPVAQAYSILREARPGILISFGLGANGDEDFTSLEREIVETPPTGKPLEIAYRLPTSQASVSEGGQQLAAGLASALRDASARGANLLIRAELRPDGSLDPFDESALLELGRAGTA